MHKILFTLTVKYTSFAAGKSYTFSDYYQSTVATKVVVQYTMTNGTLQYADIGAPATSAVWKKFQVDITPPVNTKSMTVFHLLGAVGSLTIDTASLVVK